MHEVIIVYQDCPTCGARKAWGERTIKAITESGLPYRKVSFASIEGQAHAAAAIAQGVVKYPFVTDGTRYAQNVEDLFAKPQKAKRKTKRSTKKAKEQEDGSNTDI